MIYDTCPEIEERFRIGTVLYKHPEYGYTLELWGASTKHPDSVFYFYDFAKVDWLDGDEQLFQWVLECASKLIFPSRAKKLARWALDNL